MGWTYGSDSASGRDGADSARRLAEGVAEHIRRSLTLSRSKENQLQRMQLSGGEIGVDEGAFEGVQIESFLEEAQWREKRVRNGWTRSCAVGPITAARRVLPQSNPRSP